MILSALVPAPSRSRPSEAATTRGTVTSRFRCWKPNHNDNNHTTTTTTNNNNDKTYYH